MLDGEVVACQKHNSLACERFLKDIENEEKEEFLYRFDEEKAIKFLWWMGLFKHTKGKLWVRRSYLNYGLAFDIVILTEDGTDCLRG